MPEISIVFPPNNPGPLASFLMKKMSYRKVCLLGAVLSSISLSVLPFAPNISYLIVLYGVITGKYKYTSHHWIK